MSQYRTPDRYQSARNRIGKFMYDGVRRHGPKIVGTVMAAGTRTARNLFNEVAQGANTVISAAGHRATTAIRNGAERLAKNMAGGAGMNIGSNTVVPAQLIDGRGAELAYQQLNVLKSIKFKTGESVGPQLTDAFGREKLLYQGQSAMHAFAFKMQLTVPSYVVESNNIPVNRFYVHNVFRHVLAGVNNTAPTFETYPYGNRQVSWNETLGPDRSLVRYQGGVTQLASQIGSAYTPAPNYAALGLDEGLFTPYRYPKMGTFMFSRMTRQLMENLGWNANPMKVVSITGGSGGLAPVPLNVYSNAPMNNTDSIVSFPNNLPDNTNGTVGPSYYYRSQFGRGQVSYNFSNDGTNPVVIDIVITRVKKGESVIRGDLFQLEQAYKQGYLNYSYANDEQSDLRGQPPVAEDVLTNQFCQFLPAKALDSYKRVANAGGAYTNKSTAPYKQVARDQFIIAGGASRNWSTYLQALDYDARKYAQKSVPNPGEGQVVAGHDDEANCLDEFSYVFSIACSGVPAPFIEFKGGTGNVASVIDRRGTDCSVSVSGSYKEVPHPVYLTKATKEAYVNGRLDTPGFGAASTGLSLTSNDIASIGQATRSAANSTALISMGPLNTVGGG